MKIEFFPAAERELQDAATDYESFLPGLGDDFIAEVERIAALLIELPSLGEKLDPLHRRIPLRRFPYALVFRPDGADRATGSRGCRIGDANRRRIRPSSSRSG